MMMAGPEMGLCSAQVKRKGIQVLHSGHEGLRETCCYNMLGRVVPPLPPGNGRAELCLASLLLLGAMSGMHIGQMQFLFAGILRSAYSLYFVR